MGFFSNDSSEFEAHKAIYGGGEEREGSFTHELIAGAASFEAMRKYEQYCESNGKPQSHSLAKEIIAGFSGAEVDKLFETKGLSALDREKAKRAAEKQAQNAVNEDNY